MPLKQCKYVEDFHKKAGISDSVIFSYFFCASDKFLVDKQKQKLVPEEEWDSFIAALRKPLPTTFRINGR